MDGPTWCGKMYFLLIHNCCEFNQVCSFLDCRQKQYKEQQGPSAPLLAHPSTWGWLQLYTSAWDCWGSVQKATTELEVTEMSCANQSRVGGWTSTHASLLLSLLEKSPHCSPKVEWQEIVSHKRESFWVLRNVLLWWCWWFTLSLWPYTWLPWPRNHTHTTIRLLQLHWNRFQASKEGTPTPTSHGNAVGLSHVLKRLVN